MLKERQFKLVAKRKGVSCPAYCLEGTVSPNGIQPSLNQLHGSFYHHSMSEN